MTKLNKLQSYLYQDLTNIKKYFSENEYITTNYESKFCYIVKEFTIGLATLLDIPCINLLSLIPPDSDDLPEDNTHENMKQYSIYVYECLQHLNLLIVNKNYLLTYRMDKKTMYCYLQSPNQMFNNDLYRIESVRKGKNKWIDLDTWDMVAVHCTINHKSI